MDFVEVMVADELANPLPPQVLREVDAPSYSILLLHYVEVAQLTLIL
ncbi:hypothetical protein DNHGIG_20160 [Collibacillus ludicampi]|uniref:Uncharacterized protein n=1 Tax=Collibacillus ludicampi TaxID=2771369 RepID=A0AAV4LG76_9BACL|nr:hypothetical protein DNHGIG_20160 [Collibacillus ludicampi]